MNGALSKFEVNLSFEIISKVKKNIQNNNFNNLFDEVEVAIINNLEDIFIRFSNEKTFKYYFNSNILDFNY
jgi:hypothetical protein